MSYLMEKLSKLRNFDTQ